MVPVAPPRHPTSLRAARGHQWGRTGGTEGWGHGGCPWAEQDMARLRTGTGAKGITLKDEHSLPTPQTPRPRSHSPSLSWFPTCSQPPEHPGGQRSHPLSPHPQGAPRALQGSAGSSAGLTWRLLVSPWSQALLVCFCFSGEGRQGVNPRGGAASQPSGCRVWRCRPHTPATAASPGRTLVSPTAPPTQPGQPAASPGHPGAGDTYPGAAGTSVPAGPGCAAPPGAGAACWGRRRCRDIPRPPCTAHSAASRPRPWQRLRRQRDQLSVTES